MKEITLSEYQKQFGLFVADNQLTAESRYSVCSLIRQVLSANQSVSKRELHQRFQAILKPILETDNKLFDECLKILCSLDEIQELPRDGKEPVFTATRPRWIRLDENHAVLLGNIPNSLQPPPRDGYEVVRRVVSDEHTSHLLAVNGIEEDKLSELELPNWNEWKKKLLSQNTERIPNDIQIVTGKTGDFLGTSKDTDNSGRWKKLSASTQDGIYFAQRKQDYSDPAWLLIAKNNETVQILALYDREEWRELLMARIIDENERPYNIDADTIQFTVPIPEKWTNRLRLFASQQPAWELWLFGDIQLRNAVLATFFHCQKEPISSVVNVLPPQLKPQQQPAQKEKQELENQHVACAAAVLASAEQDHVEKERQISDLESARQAEDAKSLELENHRKNAEVALAQAEQDRVEMEGKIRNLESQKQALNETLQQQEAELVRQKRHLKELIVVWQNKTAETQELERKRRGEETALAQAEQDCVEKERQIAGLESARQAEDAKSLKLENQRKNAEVALAQAEQDRVEMEDKIRNLNETLQQQEAELVRQKRHLEELIVVRQNKTAETQELERKRRTEETALAQAEQDCVEKERQISDLESARQAKEAKILELENQRKNAEVALAQAEQDRFAMEMSIKDIDRKSLSIENDLNQLESERKRRKEQLDILEAKRLNEEAEETKRQENIKEMVKNTAAAIKSGNYSSVQEFVMKEPDVLQFADKKGFTLLHFAVRQSQNIDIIACMVQNMRNVNVKNKDGETPLHFAAQCSTPEIIRLLIENGANIGATDNVGKFPVDYANKDNVLVFRQYDNR